jgi:hypothetical protein
LPDTIRVRSSVSWQKPLSPARQPFGAIQRVRPPADAAIAILERQKAIRSNDYVFAGCGTAHASIHTLDRVLKRLDRNDLTVHRFR